ncbi:RNA ligase family protein [Streptomyces sp. NPDC048057]|uniref:RNA ligase family protein n=1 Tax=Streptomyces sp. NPDC048057 TaxID=3155628 RepID=UPI0033D2D2E8
MRTHYPRTPHLPWSPGATPDDLRAPGPPPGFAGRDVVVTEKLDGENTTLYRDGLHARSLDSAHHPSRAPVKALQARLAHAVPAGWRICGENLYARHSLPYDDLDGHFYGFSVWDERGDCLDWDRTVAFLHGLGIPTPRVLWRGTYDARAEKALRALKVDTARQEGYVVRTVEGFGYADFAARVAKWVRPGHVQTDTHWMHAAVVPNRLGTRATLWDVRSGAAVDAAALARAVGWAPDGAGREVPEDAVEGFGVLGDDRLAGALALLLPTQPRARLTARLAPGVGMRTARRTADLVGLCPNLHRPYPDEARRTGLVRMAHAADPRVLHAVARALAPDAAAQEQVEWSALYAQDAGLFDAPTPWSAWPFPDLAPDAAARCRAEAREAYAQGRVHGPDEAVAATWRWRDGAFPHLIHLAGPPGSGKSSFAAGLRADRLVSLDALREAAGSRADQRGNTDVLRAGLDELDAALAHGGTVVWDATSLNRHQRSLVHAVAARRDALVTHAVVLVDEDELLRRNGTRRHPVPPAVLTAQLRRFAPPYPGEAHRTWYVGVTGRVEDTDTTDTGDEHAYQ